MRLYAYIILSALLLSIFIEPLIEVSLVYKDRIVLGAAITNSFRVAKNMSYGYQALSNLSAVVKKDVFIDNFKVTFAKALELEYEGSDSDGLVFSSVDGRYNNFYVKLTFEEEALSGSINTKVTAEAKSVYKFKTKYLKKAEDSINKAGNAYELYCIRNYYMTVNN